MPPTQRHTQTPPPRQPPRKRYKASSRSQVIDLTGSDDESMPVPIKQPRQESEGPKKWKHDFAKAQAAWGKQGEVEGFAGMVATIKDFKRGDGEHSAGFTLIYEDMDGREFTLKLNIAFSIMTHYPTAYSMHIYTDPDNLPPRRAKYSFPRFNETFGMDIKEAIIKLIESLQGNDEAGGGYPVEVEMEDSQWEEHDIVLDDAAGVAGAASSITFDMAMLKKDFEQAKAMGYRPGYTKISDHHVISYSIPFKSLGVDPNTLSMWDDGLVDAWRQDQRLHMLIKTDQYPIHIDRATFYIGANRHYKASANLIEATTRKLNSSATDKARPLDPFFLSAPLVSYLKSFGRCYKLRTAFELNWDDADAIGMDEERSRSVFQDNEKPTSSRTFDQSDPVSRGLEHNIPLVAFWWTLRRFVEAPKNCLNCGSEVKIPSLRPYVCDKPLCLYGYMSLGLGPSVEHVIKTEPLVVDLLLSFAYSAAKSRTRMDMPLGLHIELAGGGLLDDAADQPAALAEILETIPSINDIKKKLEEGCRLKDVGASSGAITALRWVVGSCRAYLKNTKPGQGVVNNLKEVGRYRGYSYTASGDVRQFTFVVGSPEQEDNFKNEIAAAQQRDKNCLTYPTMLAYHGSATERWHNILRTGLDYNEVANARVSLYANDALVEASHTDEQAYGDGVYFAPDADTSMGAYARPSAFSRPNAVVPLSTATALVELVNVPETFVSKQPYYVVKNVKQIKPFLLLVTSQDTGTEAAAASAPAVPTESKSPPRPQGQLFKHDPKLHRQPTYGIEPLKVTMPEQITSEDFVDTELDDHTDSQILNPAGPKLIFSPSVASRFDKLQLMPPPTETSVSASKTLQKEFKNLIKLQEQNQLPFYINPDTDSLYCWLLELHEFPDDSHLKKDMDKYQIRSIITEVRFPASFPHAPPFMRILHPRFLPFSSGGGGNITAGGSICNEILTMSGWNPAYCVEAMVRDIMTNMTQATPPARLDRSWDTPYTLHEAIDAFKRVAGVHGWQVPPDFDKLARPGL